MQNTFKDLEKEYLLLIQEIAKRKKIGPTELTRRAWPHQRDAARKFRLLLNGKTTLAFTEAAMLADALYQDFAQLIFAAQSRIQDRQRTASQPVKTPDQVH